MCPTRQRKGLANIPAMIAMHASYAAMTAVGCVAAVNVSNPAIVKNKDEINLKEKIYESNKLLF
jgi:hypothetical protein